MKRFGVLAAAVGLIVAGTALAQDPIAARQAAMKEIGKNYGAVNKMNRGQAPYDGAAASAAFTAIAAAASGYAALFPPGSEIGGDTEALPAIWENKADFDALAAKLEADAKAAAVTTSFTAAVGAISTQSMAPVISPNRLPPPPVRLDDTSPAWLQDLPPGAVVALPLSTADELLGLIVLGQREDTTVFDDRDLEILALIAQQATIFLKNGQQSADLRRHDQDMVNIQKETQQKIAQDLHDHVLPLMSRLQLKLLTGSRLLPEIAMARYDWLHGYDCVRGFD